MPPKKPPSSRVPALLKALEAVHPDAKCGLEFLSPLQLLIATILSAQCTDKRVNLVTPALFKRFSSAKAFANAKLE
jgi:endonuclease-3